jgi:hypothetical protein
MGQRLNPHAGLVIPKPPIPQYQKTNDNLANVGIALKTLRVPHHRVRAVLADSPND